MCIYQIFHQRIMAASKCVRYSSLLIKSAKINRFLRCMCSLSEESESIRHNLPQAAAKVDYLPPSLYGGRHIVTMIDGHGIGPELCKYIRELFDFMNVPIDFDMIENIKTEEDVKHAIISVKRNGCCIKGNIDISEYKHLFDEILYSSPNIAIRRELDMFVNLNVFQSYKNVLCKYSDLDIVVIRQNTEGEYSLMEHESTPGIIESTKVCTRNCVERTARWAINYVLATGRKKLTIVHKANIMKLSDGLFLETVKQVGLSYPEVKIDDIIIDNCCMQMVSNPYQFDVIICPNLYGTILCNLICGLIGGAGMTSGHNYGDYYAVFETSTRSTAKQLAGKNVANPIAMFNAAVDLLTYLGLTPYAQILEDSIKKTIEIDGVTTSDIGGTATTIEVFNSVKANVHEAIPHMQDHLQFNFNV